MIDDLVKGTMLVRNADSLSLTSRRQVSAGEEATVFMTRSKVEDMLNRKKEKAYVSSICLDLKPLYAVNVSSQAYLVGVYHATISKVCWTEW